MTTRIVSNKLASCIKYACDGNKVNWNLGLFQLTWSYAASAHKVIIY